MHFSGAAATSFPRLTRLIPGKATLLGLGAALALSACVDPSLTGTSTATPEAPAAPAIDTAALLDGSIYGARSDAKFSVPALPVEKIPETYRRQMVAYETDQPPGTIIIDPTKKLLYYITGKNQALRYGISVGREGFQWSGEAVVSRKREWPTWTPPQEMIARTPSLEKWKNGQPGGPTNPLGSRAIYLTTNGVDYGYRIHGTPEWKSIGRNASSGCFRMINQDVMDLFDRVQGGEKVIVLTASGQMPTKLNIQKPPTPKKAADPKAAAPAEATPALIGPVAPGAAPAPTITTAPLAGAPAATPEVSPAAVTAPVAPAAVTPTAITPAESPAPVVAPAAAAPVTPTVTPPATAPAAVTPAPAASPAPACSVPLINGACPAN